MSPADGNRLETLRYQLELFVDGSARDPAFLQRLAADLGELFPGDPLVEEFLTTAMVYGSPEAAFFRTEEEMVQECERLRRHLPALEA